MMLHTSGAHKIKGKPSLVLVSGFIQFPSRAHKWLCLQRTLRVLENEHIPSTPRYWPLRAWGKLAEIKSGSMHQPQTWVVRRPGAQTAFF